MCALGEMVDHVSLVSAFHEPFVDISPGMAWLEACESRFTHLKSKETVAEECSVWHFLGVQQSLGATSWTMFIGHRAPKIQLTY